MNKAEKSLRWVVNQIPDFTPKSEEEKMLLAIKRYCAAGADEIKRIEAENAALRERLSHSLELPYMEQTVSQYGTEDTVLYYMENGKLQQECFNNKFPEQLQAKLAELKGGKQ